MTEHAKAALEQRLPREHVLIDGERRMPQATL